MRMSEADYKKWCENRGQEYDGIDSKFNTEKIHNNILKKEWMKKRNRKIDADINQSEKIVINGSLPGLNEIIAACKQHYSTYSNMKRDHSQVIEYEAINQTKYRYNRIDVNINWVEKNAMRDKDNISAGTKFILDGLVDAAIIEEDGWKNINSINHSYDIDSKNPRIEIEIIEVENE